MSEQTNMTSKRCAVVTGAGSGIGEATLMMLKEEGYDVLGVDLKGAKIECDITDKASTCAMVEEVSKRFGGKLDVLIANAGVNAPKPFALDVNFFGTIASIEALLPLLEQSDSPRISVTSSAATLQPYQDDELIDLLLAGKRDEALARGEELTQQEGPGGYLNYSSSKRALSRWIRKVAPTDPYAGKGIAINAVGPGVVITEMTREMLATEEGKKQVLGAMPCPLGGPAEAEHIAAAHVFLASEKNARMTGQVLFVDGGYDTIARGDNIFAGGEF